MARSRWWERPAPGGSEKERFWKGVRGRERQIPDRLTYPEAPRQPQIPREAPPPVQAAAAAPRAGPEQPGAPTQAEAVERFTAAPPAPVLPAEPPPLAGGIEFPQAAPQPVPQRPPAPWGMTYDEQGQLVPFIGETLRAYGEAARERITEGYEAPARREAGLEPIPEVPEAPWEDIRRDLVQAAQLPEGTAPREAAGQVLEGLQRGAGRLIGYTSPAARQLEAKSPAARALGQTLGTALAVLDEPTQAVQSVISSVHMEDQVREAGLAIDEWYPLTESGYSFLVDDIDGALFNSTEGNDLARAIAQVRAGEQPERVAESFRNTWAQFGGEVLLDPFNLLDAWALIAKAGKAGKFARHADDVMRAIPDLPRKQARELLDTAQALQRAADSQGDEVAQALAEVTTAAGRRVDQGAINRVADAFRKPLDLIPAAKVERDLQEIWLASQNVFGGARTSDDVKELARLWTDAPDELARTFGRSVVGPHGTKARITLAQLGDAINDLPSMKADEFHPGDFLVEFTEEADKVLRKGYGVTDPGPYLRFAQAAKGLMSEFYLNPVFSPGFATRQLMSDLFVTLWEGVNPFRGRRAADDFLERIGLTTKRVVTEGKGLREFMTGIPEGRSRLPGLAGRYSRFGQELARRGDILGIPIGEESRYRRVFAELLEGAYKQNALTYTPAIPAEFVPAGWENRLDDLRVKLAMEFDEAEKRKLIERALDAESPAHGLAPSKYLSREQKHQIPAGLMRELQTRLDALPADAGPDDVQRVFDDLGAMVDDAVNDRYADMEHVPTAQSLDANEADAAQDYLDDMRVAVEESDGPELARAYEEVVEEVKRIEAEADQVRDALVEDVVTTRRPEGMEIAIAALVDVEDYLQAIRQELGQVMMDTARAVREEGALGRALWPEYFRQAREGWGNFAQQRLERMNLARQQMADLANGRPVDIDLEALATERLWEVSQVVEPPEGAAPGLRYVPGSVSDPDDAENFQRFLASQRAGLDVARIDAYRTMMLTQPDFYGDALDIINGTAADVDRLGAAAAGRVKRFRDDALAKTDELKAAGGEWSPAVKRVWEQFYVDRNEAWGEFFKRAEERWQLADKDLAYRNVGEQVANMGPIPGDAELVRSGLGKRAGRRTPQEQAALQRRDNAIERLELRRQVARQIPMRYDPDTFRADLEAIAGLSSDEAAAVAAVADARARTWAEVTGRDPADWYAERLAGIERGGRPELRQEIQEAEGIFAKGAVEFLDDQRAIIRAFEQSDVSTMVHELGHVFRRELDAEDLAAATSWATGDPAGVWDEIAEERFARGFERYLAEGVAPTTELGRVFEQLKQWLTSIYRAIVGSDIDVNIDDRMRGVYDRLLAEAPEPRMADELGRQLQAARRRRERVFTPTAPGAGFEQIPLTVDEARRIYGEDMGRILEERGNQHFLDSEADQIRARVEQESYGPAPEGLAYVEVGGERREVSRKRVRSRAAERRAYWEYMDITPPESGNKADLARAQAEAKEFRERNKQFSDWYYDLALADMEGREVGQPPEFIAREAIEALENIPPERLMQRSPFEGTPEFQARLGNTAVVDEQGRPMVVYHGTRSPVDFEPSEFGQIPTIETDYGFEQELVEWSGSPDAFIGTHFAEEPEVASGFAGGEPLGSRDWRRSRWVADDAGDVVEFQAEAGPRVIPAYLNIENPIRFETEDDWTQFMLSRDMGHSDDVEAAGYRWAARNDSDIDEFFRRYESDPDYQVAINQEVLTEPIETEFGREMNRWFAEDIADSLLADLRQRGHDGVRYRNDVEGGISWIAFEPEQIISPAERLGPVVQRGPMTQLGMFEAGEDLPLFSGTAQRAQIDAYNPVEEAVQPSLPGLQRSPEEILDGERARRSKAKPGPNAPPGQQMLFQSSQPGNTKGAGLTSEMTDIMRRETQGALDSMREGMLGEWGAWQAGRMDDAAKQRVLEWWDTDGIAAHRDFRTAALQYAGKTADSILLDYSRRNKIDEYLSYFVPYSYWFTRTGANWARRLSRRPAALLHYLRLRDSLREENEAAGRRRRFAGMFPIPAPWLPDWMGQTLFLDPITFMVPFASFDRRDWSDPEETQRGLQAFYQGVNRAGLRLYPWWEAAYQGGFAQRAGEAIGMPEAQAEEYLGPEIPGNFPFVLPMTRQIQALTSGQPWAPPGGLNIEAPIRGALGLPRGEVWAPYRTNRMLANIAAERGAEDLTLARTALMAQELNQAWAQAGQVGTPWVAGDPMAQEIAAANAWTPEETAAAQQLLIEAMNLATREQAVGTMGYLAGPRAAIEPAGERRQMELSQQLGEAAWVPGGPGSREAYEQIREQFPAIRARQQQYGVIEERQGLQPAAMANYIAARQAKDQTNQRFDAAVDEFLRTRPWDTKGARQVNSGRFDEFGRIEERYPVPEMGQFPPTRYGMNPAEQWDALAEDRFWEWKETKPAYNNYPDYASYEKAVAKWEQTFPEVYDFGQPQLGQYAGLSPVQAYRQWEQRNDTPMQALAEVYGDVVVGPAWDRYHAAKAAGEKYSSRWPRIIGAIGPMQAEAMIPAVLAAYPGRWSEQELKQVYSGVVFPRLEDQLDD